MYLQYISMPVCSEKVYILTRENFEAEVPSFWFPSLLLLNCAVNMVNLSIKVTNMY
jgi:hypothetical protein